MMYEDCVDDIGHSSGSLTDPTSSGSELGDSEDDGSIDDVPWSESVGKKGDVFYVEPSLGPISSIAIDKQPLTVNNLDKNIRNSTSSTTKNWKGNLKKQFRKSITERLKNGIGGGGKTDEVIVGIHGVKFQDKTGVLKEVNLFIDPEKNNFGRRATLLESLFGIIPGHFANDDCRIMVQGLAPHGEAMRSREVKIGDWLMKIDDLEVNFDNINGTLNEIQTRRNVKLSLQRFAQEAYITSPIMRRNQDTENLVRFMNGLEMPEIHNVLNIIPHAAMYLTLDCVTSSSDVRTDDEVIAYKFPKQVSDVSSLCGLYISLSHMLKEATNSDVKYTTMLCNGQRVHVGLRVFGKEVLAIAVPADKVPLTSLSRMTDHIVDLTTFLFGSVSNAFKSVENEPTIDHLLSLLFQRLLLSDELSKKGISFRFSRLLDDGGVRWLNLPDAAKVDVNNVLSDLESSDFGDMSDDYYGIRRRYVINGSCLYHKGFLVASHLPSKDLTNVNLYVQYYCLLALSRHRFLSQLIIWKEVYKANAEDRDEPLPGYNESNGRSFLLIVGMKHSLLCVLLQTGGCAEYAVGNPPPDPFYVDQAKATLVHLQSIDLVGICDRKFREPSTPQLANPESFFPNAKIARADSLTQLDKTGVPSSPTKKAVNPPESILKKRGSPNSSQRRGSISGSVGERESDADSIQSVGSNSNPALVRGMSQRSSAGSNESVASGTSGTLFRNQKQMRNLPSIFDLNGIRITNDELIPEIKLTSGLDNVLFHYVHIDCTDGLILSPLNVESSTQPSYGKLVENFAACCQRIRAVFAKTESRARRQSSSKSSVSDDCSLSDVREHGVLFECEPENWSDSKRSPPKMSYWVVGRMIEYGNRQQVYLCFHESIPQHIIEMLFQLQFGNSL